MKAQTFDVKSVFKLGGLGGFTLLYLSLVGLVSNFVTRDVISKTMSLSFAFVIITTFLFGYLTARRTSRRNWFYAVGGGVMSGAIGIACLIILVLLTAPLNLQAVFVNASPALIKVLTFGKEPFTAGLLPLTGWAVVSSLTGAMVYMLPPNIRRAVIAGVVAVIAIGTLAQLLSDVVENIFALLGNKRASGALLKIFFAKKGLSVSGAAIIFVLTILVSAFSAWRKQIVAAKEQSGAAQTQTPKEIKIAVWIVSLLVILLLPNIFGSYLSEIVVTVAIYTLMGFGLNIVVGFAGLLDLGYVAFFAIGAYTMALLTSNQMGQTTELVNTGLSFWAALPISIGVAVLWGIILGVPVLRMRGDYLAIVTLGFGEIIRVLALSNFLQPKIGGAQGILGIAKPVVFGYELVSSQQLYYLVVAAALLAAYVSWRMRDSRAGRSWMAMREDEDVAEAMGINLIKTKLLAFATGAAFSGFAGAIFAAKLGSIYPASFNLLVSINVLSLIIVGGIGSLPGVVIGAVALVGLPELLREFSEFRMLIFGALLVGMMLFKPEGFWPAAAQKRELHEFESEEVEAHPASEAA